MGRAAAIAYAREDTDVAINYLPSEEPDAQEAIAPIKAAMTVGSEGGGIVSMYLSIPQVAVAPLIWRRCYCLAARTEVPPNLLEVKG